MCIMRRDFLSKMTFLLVNSLSEKLFGEIRDRVCLIPAVGKFKTEWNFYE
jgi:hypothetical protein